MFSNNLKRSVATLGVVAGVLAAAVPASAIPVGVSPPGEIDALKAGASEVLYETVTVKTDVPDARNISIATAEVFELNTIGGNDTLSARGTQVGSEGVKAPTDADHNLRGEAIDIIP